MNHNNLGVALTKRACPVCGNLEDADILLNTMFTEYSAKKVESLHGKTIGFLEKECSDCANLMTQGIIFVSVDEKLTIESNHERSKEIMSQLNDLRAMRSLSRSQREQRKILNEEFDNLQLNMATHNPHRTGGFYVIKEEAVKKIVTAPQLLESILEKRVTFIDDKTCEAIGLTDHLTTKNFLDA